MGLFDFFKRKKKKPVPTVEIQKNPPVEIKKVANVSAVNIKEISEEIMNDICDHYIAFDVETTGLMPGKDRIIEIGAVEFVKGIPSNSFSTLVNPQTKISPSASAVNHITDEMLMMAPSEEKVYSELMDFLGNALNKGTIICAHNAKFDMDFLCNTLSRLGFDANIRYLDTLALSRKFIKGPENYKQVTLAQYFGFEIENAHRALDDATVCGKILWKIAAQIQEKREKEAEQIAIHTPKGKDLELCAYIQNMLVENKADITMLRFRVDTSGYLDCKFLYSFLKFKTNKKGTYVILYHGFEVIKNSHFITEPCSVSEGGASFLRLYFTTLEDLQVLNERIVAEYQHTRSYAKKYMDMGEYCFNEAWDTIRPWKKLNAEEVTKYLEIGMQDHWPINEKAIKSVVQHTRDDVVVQTTYQRIPIEEIKYLNDEEKGFDVGGPYYFNGEDQRKDGNEKEAVLLFDKARENGYISPALYESYAKAFHKMKAYADEIVILEEGIERLEHNTGKLETRRQNAIEALYRKQNKEKENALKAKRKEERRKIQNSQSPGKQGRRRIVIQYDENMYILKKYSSAAEASRETGCSAQHIRDAAKGVREQAGGFFWRYQEDIDRDERETSNGHD